MTTTTIIKPIAKDQSADTIADFIKSLYRYVDNGSLELRTFTPDNKTGPRIFLNFNSLDTLHHFCKHNSSLNVYFGVATRDGRAGKKENIVQIPSVWCDIDFKDIAEDEAHIKLSEFPFKPSIVIHSGGGIHCYWVLSEPAGMRDIPLLESYNKRIAQALGGDSKACDAARILRMPKTWNVKPEYDSPRPVEIMESNDFEYCLDDFQILPEPDQICDKAQIQTCEKSTPYGLVAVESLLADLKNAESGSRNDTLNKTSFRIGRLIAGGEVSEVDAETALTITALDIGLHANETTATIKSGITAGKKKPLTAPGRAYGDYEHTEDGYAQVASNKFNGQFLYDHTIGKWYIWTGHYWCPDLVGLVHNNTRNLIRELNWKKDKSHDSRAKKSFSTNVTGFMANDPVFASTNERWDRDPFLLGTPGGVVDLRKGVMRPGQKKDFITKQTAVVPADNNNAPLWEKFLLDSTGNDIGCIRFLQQICGYFLTADTSEHALFFVHGPGGNGKSVFLTVIQSILNDYSKTAAMNTFMASRYDQHPTDLAMLCGSRLVTASETEEGRRWAEAKIKQLTGGDIITARFMRQDFFSFTPQFKLLIVGNHAPRLNNVDDALRRRFNIIPFTRKPQNPDRHLTDKIKDEFPNILRWMIDGCIDWQANGLVRPQMVVNATKDYFDEQDLFGQWIDDCCVTSKYTRASTKELYASWEAFNNDCGECAGTQKVFSQNLNKYGFNRCRFRQNGKMHRGFSGIGLASDRV
jgi:putative DNA primase/helicase